MFDYYYLDIDDIHEKMLANSKEQAVDHWYPLLKGTYTKEDLEECIYSHEDMNDPDRDYERSVVNGYLERVGVEDCY